MEMQRALEGIAVANRDALGELSRQIERMTAVILLNTPDGDAAKMDLIKRMFE